MRDPVELLADWVAIRSVSGEEAALRDQVAGVLAAGGARPVIRGRNVYATRGDGRPTLLLNTHLDTVPASGDWTRDPWAATREGERLHGLGANDAKASLAAMVTAFLTWDGRGGTVVAAFTCDEETGGEGLEQLARELVPLDAAVIGEPTGLCPALGQRGLLRLDVVVRGRRGHASRPEEGVNAVHGAARDIAGLAAMEFPGVHPRLGRTTLQVTRVEGGVAVNVIPPECRFTVDCRTTPDHPNEAVLDRVRALVGGEVRVRSTRFQPVETPPESPIARAALEVAGGRAYDFRGVSDLIWAARAGAAGVILGPGASAQSHAADEWVALDEVRRATGVYGRLVEAYLREAGGS
ncbi:MAG: M20/M25/M40 family metallo-hydrolase [Planctomycetes bacterium]|nr:M20/M25/M40 family metallo-hydrolase [Planctomycetota bacterium]